MKTVETKETRIETRIMLNEKEKDRIGQAIDILLDIKDQIFLSTRNYDAAFTFEEEDEYYSLKELTRINCILRIMSEMDIIYYTSTEKEKGDWF